MGPLVRSPVVRKPRRTWPQRLLIVFNAMLVVVCFGSAAALTYVQREVSEVPRVSMGSVLDESPPSSEPQNILMVGVDDGTGLAAGDPVNIGRTRTSNTDTIMILRVDPGSEQALLLSLPRDLWLPIGGSSSKGRINSAMALGGPERLIQTIQTNFDIPIHHFVQVDFAGFKELVSAIGGVPIYFPWQARDKQTGLDVPETGCITLDADQALAFARSRYFEINEGNGWKSDPSSDYGRISRQQTFIKAALKRAVARGVRNPFTLTQLIGVAQKNVTLDDQLTTQNLIDLGTQFRNFDPESLEVFTPPTRGGFVGDASVVFLDERAAQPMFDLFRGVDAADDVIPSIRVEVRNGSGVNGQGRAALDALAFHRFVPVRSIDASIARYDRTTIVYAPGSELQAVEVARFVDGVVDFVADEDLPGDVTVALVTADDFTAIRAEPRPAGDFSDFLTSVTTTTEPLVDDLSTTSTTVTDDPAPGFVPAPPPGVTCG
jgi:polyisoprenyl-teichoic acid--peptidoglycan teichoic acid transferase